MAEIRLEHITKHLDRSYEGGALPKLKRLPSEYLRSGNVCVTCEADEDIAHVLKCIGEDYLVMGSDYPHIDISLEEDMVEALQSRTGIPGRVRSKVLLDNPLRLYNLPA